MMATTDDDDGGLGASHGSLARPGSAHPPQPPPPPQIDGDGGGSVDESHRSLVNACYAQRGYGESQYVRCSGPIVGGIIYVIIRPILNKQDGNLEQT